MFYQECSYLSCKHSSIIPHLQNLSTLINHQWRIYLIYHYFVGRKIVFIIWPVKLASWLLRRIVEEYHSKSNARSLCVLQEHGLDAVFNGVIEVMSTRSYVEGIFAPSNDPLLEYRYFKLPIIRNFVHPYDYMMWQEEKTHSCNNVCYLVPESLQIISFVGIESRHFMLFLVCFLE